MIDLSDYKTSSRLSPHINAGASARLNLQPMVTSLTGEAGQAFAHGWRTTDLAENRAGRPMPRHMSEFERQEAIDSMLAAQDRLSALQLQHTGHGHVVPRLDGSRTRCGGPAMCPVCQREQSVAAALTAADIVWGMPLDESQLLGMAAAAQRAAHGPGSRIAELIDRMRNDLHDPGQADRLDAMAGLAGGVISPPCQHCGGGPVYCRHCMGGA